jgi:predicted ester cyclase
MAGERATTSVGEKAVARRFLEVLNTKDFSAATDMFSPTAEDHAAGSLTTYLTLAAFPDFRLNPEHIVAEGEFVTLLATFTGTHSGRFMGMEPTHKGVTGRAAFGFRVCGETITATWTEIEPWSLLQQLGAFEKE